VADKTRVIRLVADASQFKKELGELVTATKKVATASEQTAKSMGKIESLGKSVGTAIKGIAVAATALAAVKAIGQAAKDMSDLYESSQKLGVSVETLSAFGYAAQMSGVSTESLGVGLKQLNRNLTDMDTATTKSANALRALGVVSSDTGEEAFKKIADQLAKMPDSANKTALAMAVFGKSGSDLIPMLNEGAAGLQAMADEAERFGVAISSDTAAAADAFGDNVDRMNFAMKGAVRQITAGLLPSMVTLTNEMVGAVNEGDRFVSMGETLGEMLIDVAEFGLHTARSVETFGEAIGTTAAAIAAAARGEFALAKQMFVEFGQEAEREAMAVEERIKKLRAAFNSARTTPAGAGPGTRNAQTDGIGTDWSDTSGGGGRSGGSTRRRSTPALIRDQLEEAEKYFDALIRIRDALTDMGQSNADLEQIAEAWKKGAKAGEAMEESLARQNELIQWKKDNPEVTDADVAKMNELLAKRDELNVKIGETQNKIQQDMDNAKQAADAVSGVFVDWATGIIDAEGALKGFVAILLDFLAKKYVLDFLMNSFGGGEANARGAAWAGGVKLMAKGGVLNSATAMGVAGGKMQIAGEAGPEGVLPLRRDRNGNLGVIAAGRPQLSVVVNNNAGVDVSTSISPDGGLTLDIVRKAISNDIARGGSSVARAMERVYGVGRGR